MCSAQIFHYLIPPKKQNNMASLVGDALIAKLHAIFANEENETFLSYCVPGFGLKPQNLSFDIKDGNNAQGLTPKQALSAQADFSFLVNRIAHYNSKWMPSDRMLWSEFGRVLETASVSDPQPSAKDYEQLDKSYKLLYGVKFTDRDEDELLVSTQLYNRYKELRTDYRKINRKLNQYKIELEVTDPKVDNLAYRIIEGKINDTQLDAEDAMDTWILEGQKNKIESAVAAIEHITSNSPLTQWIDWNQNFKKFKLTDLKFNSTFFSTHYFPNEFWKSGGNWITVNIESREVTPLAIKLGPSSNSSNNDIPESLSDSSLQLEIKIKNLSVEIARVDIIRPWLFPELFQSPFWKWNSNDNQTPLSDGMKPPKGSLIGYPIGLLFIRNLKVNLDANDTTNAIELSKIESSNSQSTDIRNAGNHDPQNISNIGPISLDASNATISNNELKSNKDEMQLIGFICKLTPQAPKMSVFSSQLRLRSKPVHSGRFLLSCKGAFIARLNATFQLDGKSQTSHSKNIPVLQREGLIIPEGATNIRLKIEVMTLPLPESWKIVKTIKHSNPKNEYYEVSGSLFNVKVKGPVPVN